MSFLSAVNITTRARFLRKHQKGDPALAGPQPVPFVDTRRACGRPARSSSGGSPGDSTPIGTDVVMLPVLPSADMVQVAGAIGEIDSFAAELYSIVRP